jgi:hypothetical protein
VALQQRQGRVSQGLAPFSFAHHARDSILYYCVLFRM